MKFQLMDIGSCTGNKTREEIFMKHDDLRKNLLMNNDPELFQLYHDIFIAPTHKYNIRKEELLRLYVLCGYKEGLKELKRYFDKKW